MINVIQKAKIKARKSIESLYDCTCVIRAYEKFKNPTTKETKTGINPIPKYENQSCKVSKQSLSKNNQTDTVNKVVYEIKLFIAPELDINQGDEIEVTKFWTTTKYRAGEGFIYNTHQEVILRKEGKA